MVNIIHGSARFASDGEPGAASILVTHASGIHEQLEPGEKLHLQCLAGEFGDIAPYAEEELPAEELKRIAAERRDERLIEPVFVDLGGHIIKIKMDAPGRAGLSEAVMTATMDPSATFRWTSSDGEVTLTAEQLKGCALVATRMAQEIRNRYADLVALIDEWKVTKASQITFGQ